MSREINRNMMQKSKSGRGQDTNNTCPITPAMGHARMSHTRTHTRAHRAVAKEKRRVCVKYDSGSIAVFVVVLLWGVCVCVYLYEKLLLVAEGPLRTFPVSSVPSQG